MSKKIKLTKKKRLKQQKEIESDIFQSLMTTQSRFWGGIPGKEIIAPETNSLKQALSGFLVFIINEYSRDAFINDLPDLIKVDFCSFLQEAEGKRLLREHHAQDFYSSICIVVENDTSLKVYFSKEFELLLCGDDIVSFNCELIADKGDKDVIS